MHLIGNVIGGIFKIILSPLTTWIMSLLYGILIRGPLTVLNYLDLSFQKLSGSKVDQLLLSTSVTDGHTKINFFTSDSPLKWFFIIMIGVSGALLAVFVGIILLRSISSKKSGGPVRKIGKMVMSSAIVFAIPAIFLVVLSLSGGVLSAINGEHINISSNNIASYKKSTIRYISNLKTSNQTASNSFDSSHKLSGMKDKTKTIQNPNGINTKLSLDEIYLNLSQDKSKYNTNDSVKQIAQQVQDDYQDLKRLLVTNDLSSVGNEPKFNLNSNLDSQLAQAITIINQLKPNLKNENMADNIKSLQNFLQTAQTKINKWVEDSDTLISYEGTDRTNLQNRAIANYRNAFDIIYGRKSKKELQKVNTINNIQELNQTIGYLISGDTATPGYGLINLRQHLSDLKENSLVVTFYQVATGNKDRNWDRSFGDFKEDGFMLLVGCALIITACVIMLHASLFAVTRIFDLGLLFIISPAVVTMSASDDGQRMRTWINMVIAKLIGIFGIVISLRLFGTLNDVFRHNLENSSMNKGSSGYLSLMFMQSIFGIGGMLAAYKSSQTLSGIVGAGYGIMDGMQMGQAIRMLKTGSRIGGGFALGAGSALGLKGTSGNAGMNGKNNTRGGLGSIANTWRNRSAKLNNSLAKASRGKLGSARARNIALDNRKNKFESKIEKLKNKNALKRGLAFKKAPIVKAKRDFNDFKNNLKTKNSKRGKN